MAVTRDDLSRLPLFAAISKSSLDALLTAGREARYAAGQVITLEGDVCQGVEFVVSGLLRARQTSLEGREYTLSYLGPGTCINLVPVLDGKPAVASTDALNDAVTYRLSGRDLRHLMEHDPALAQAVAQMLAADVRRLSAMVKSLALHTVRVRLARFLLSAAETSPAQHRWTQESIAAQLGTVRDVVGRVLRTFLEEGLVRRERGQLVVVDRGALEREADG
jgi:CRP/FNR family transcriptional regulator